MKIVVNHLTRMQPGRICVAGIDLGTGRHVRPMLQTQLSESLLAAHGGVFDIGWIVDLGRPRYLGKRPAFEDFLIQKKDLARCGALGPGPFWQVLQGQSRRRLTEIFGPQLTRRGRSCVTESGQGSASLGCLLTDSPAVWIRTNQGRPQIRLQLRSGPYEFELPVTDIRLYAEDHQTPNRDLVARLNKQMQDDRQIILSVGLSRPFKKQANEPPLHWLQVNNVHLPSRPCWQLVCPDNSPRAARLIGSSLDGPPS